MSIPKTDPERLAPWIPEIQKAAREANAQGATWLRASVLSGLILRESAAGWALGYTRPGRHTGWGDGRRAFGLVQCDRRFWDMALRGMLPGVDLTTAIGQFRFTCGLLAGAHRFLAACHPGVPFLVEKGAIAAYNGDLSKVEEQLDKGGDVDSVTTGLDYGKDVLERAERLERDAPEWYM